jgi:acetyl-CoA synthetase
MSSDGAAAAGEGFVWSPSAEQAETSRLRRFMRTLEVADVPALHDVARRFPERFWTAATDDIGVEWAQPFDAVMDRSAGLPWTRFWVDGRLNLAWQAVHRWAARTPARIALVWEDDAGATRSLTCEELALETARAAAALRALGVNRGDAVGLCLPMSPECVALFVACAQLGAIVVPLFSGYGAGAIVSRLRDCDARVLCIADGFMRRGSWVDMEAVTRDVAAALPTLRHVLVTRRRAADEQARGGVTAAATQRTVDYATLLQEVAATFDVADTDANDPFMIIYTSGTTGRPKGTVHVHGGFPLKSMQDMTHCFDVGPDDRLLWFTDIGWMMGPWAIAGGLSLGATLVLFEGVPDHPGPDRLWDVVQRHRVTVLGVAPTVVRALLRHGTDPVRAHDLSSLRILGSTGEPWNTAPWMWFFEEVGRSRLPIINYSGGTEIGGGILGGNLLTPLRPCAFAGPVPGMVADVWDEQARPLRGEVGELVLLGPWPGMTQGFWHDPERYLETYWSRWPDVWVHGDWVETDDAGLWYVRGRSDDTIKVAGKRLGPAEVESALVADAAVAEAAAVGVPDDVKGEALVAFVVLKPGVEDSPALRGALSARLSDQLGRALRPKAVEIVSELPKTRNAKVLRRVVRAVYIGADPGDLSSLENPGAIAALQAVRPG